MMNEENKKLGGDETPRISLRVKGIGEKEALFTMKRSTQLKKLMNAYCSMKHFDINSIMFLFNGYQLRAEQTPLELDMEDGDGIEAVIDAIDDDEQDECCSTHLIDEDGTFNAVGLDNFIKKVKLGECGISYVVVAIIGPQGSGKSTLLNHLFHTNFREMDAYKGRSQTTKGVWIARCAGIEPCTIVMDLEGTNGRETGEDDTEFEKQSAHFALAVSDIVLINMWCRDIWLQQAANTPLLKTIFQVMLRLSIPRKTSLLFVIRDKTRTPLEILEPVLREGIQKIWDSIPKPDAHKHTPLSVFVNVQVVALSSYEDKEEQFKEQVVGFRQKFFQSTTPGGLAGDRRGVVPASGFSFSAQQIWEVIKENKDLDLVAHKVMVATVLCDEIAKKKYSSFVSNKDWIELQKVLQSLFIPSLGEKLSSLLYNCLSSYDEEVTYFEDSVRSAKRKQLEENLMQLVQPACQLMLGYILPEMLENFKKALNDALGGGLGFAAAAHDCSKEFTRLFEEKYGIKQVFWDLAKVRDRLSCDLDSQIAEIRTAKLLQLSSQYESQMKEALCGPVEALLKGGRDDTWSAIRNLLHQETGKAVSEFSFALSRFEIGEQEKEDIISNLKNYSLGLVEGKAREEAGKVLYHMKERFTYIIKYDDDSMRRLRSGKEDIQAITKNAQSSSLSLLSMLAAIRLDEETDTIRDTLFLTLMDTRIGNGKSCDLRDPLASSMWEEVPATKTLITPTECKSLWNQFKKETEYTVTQPIVSQVMMSRKRSHSQMSRLDMEPEGQSDFLDPHPTLQFARGTEERKRLGKLLGREIRPPRTIDWELLETLGETPRAVGIVGAEGQTPWRRMFDAGFNRAYREFVFEFLSTFRFTPVPRDGSGDRDPVTHEAVTFRLGRVSHSMTLAEWAVCVGFYTVHETRDPQFYTDEVGSESGPLVAWWPTISDQTWMAPLRASSLRDPLHRYLHRCIAHTIAGRVKSQEQVTLHDVFYMRSLLSPRRANVAYCMAVYFSTLHQGKRDSPITCGAYITVLARNLGLYTDEILSRQTVFYAPTYIGRQTVVAMSIAAEFDGQLRWSFDKGVTIWQLPVEGEAGSVMQQHGAHLPPTPPSQKPMQPRVVVKPVPPTHDYMRQSLHMHRCALHLQQESHAMMQWTVGLLRTWATRQGLPFHEPPTIVPFDDANDVDDSPAP